MHQTNSRLRHGTWACVRAAIVVGATYAAGAQGVLWAEMLPTSAEVDWKTDTVMPEIDVAMHLPSEGNSLAVRDACSTEAWQYVLGEQATKQGSNDEEKEFHPAPEPSSLLLAAMAAAGLLRMRRRSR